MEVAQKIITAIGAIIGVIGLGWGLFGAFEFFSGFKNGNPEKKDSGMTGIIAGAALAVIAPSIAVAINAALGALSF